MPEGSDAGRSSRVNRCEGCGNEGKKVELRPVAVVGREEPKRLCSHCYDVLNQFDLIDLKADKEFFCYGK